MRIRTILLLTTLGGCVAGVGCGANEVKLGDGSPPPGPLVTPDAAAFAAVQDVLDDPYPEANCAQSNLCHQGPTGFAGLVLVTTTATPATPAEVNANRELLQCETFTSSFDAPFGAFYTTMCDLGSAGNAVANPAPQHAGRVNFTNADCQAIMDWLETGSGTPDECP